MTKLAVIIGSIREQRVSDKLARWVDRAASQHADVEMIDLRDYPLPFYDEPGSPRFNPARPHIPAVQKWTSKIAEFDGYVIVTPEYNRALPGVLKNALDNLGNEIQDKPVALVAHGTTGGAQAVASLRITLPGNGAVTLPNALFFTDHVGRAIDDEGMLQAELEGSKLSERQASLEALVATLAAYAKALQTVRK